MHFYVNFGFDFILHLVNCSNNSENENSSFYFNKFSLKMLVFSKRVNKTYRNP